MLEWLNVVVVVVVIMVVKVSVVVDNVLNTIHLMGCSTCTSVHCEVLLLTVAVFVSYGRWLGWLDWLG